MLLMWLSVLLCSISWLYGITIYTDAIPWIGWSLVSVGILLASLGLRRRAYPAPDVRFSLLAVPLVLASIVLPLPYGVPPALMAIGILLLLWSRARWLAYGLLFAASVLTLQSVVPGIYGVITSRSPTVGGVTPVIYGLLRFFRTPVSYSQNMLFFRTMRELYETQVTWAAMGLLPALLFMAGGLVIIYVSTENLWRKLAQVLACIGIYVVMRYVVLLIVFLYLSYFIGYEEETSRVYLFWNPVWTGVTFLPLVFLLNSILQWGGSHALFFSSKERTLKPRHRASIWLICLAVFLATGALGFHDPGRSKRGRVMIDEKHSKWTVSTRQYDTRWYGAESGYNYYCMAEYLGKYFPVSRNLKTITPEVLDSSDVLILKIPTEAFSLAEMQAIIEFVRGGGGLFLIGDHTNVFGSSTYLNPIARHFGFRFRYDCLFDLEDVFTQVYRRPRILPHPIVQRMPPFLFAVSCSIEPKSFMPGRVILAGGLKRLGIDYSVSNFYPQVTDQLGMWFGTFHQAVAVPYGKGRIVGFTDSTVYSNFAAFYPGKPEFLLGAVDWLNRENRFSPLNRVFLVASLCAFVLAAYLYPRDGAKDPWYWSAVLVCALTSVSLAALLFGSVTRAGYHSPSPARDFTSVVFEQSHCDYDLPLTGFVDEHTRSYEIFFQWVLRLGYIPSVGIDIDDSIAGADIVVFINPVRRFDDSEMDALMRFAARGGRILVADGPGNPSESSEQLLRSFGIALDKTKVVDASPAYEPLSQQRWDLGEAFPLGGGTPLLFTEEAHVVSTFTRHGQGLVLAVSFSHAFSDASMGFTEGVIPDAELLHHYKLQFAFLKGLAEGRVRETLMNAGRL